MLYYQDSRPFWRRHPWVSGAAALLSVRLLLNEWYTATAVIVIVVTLIGISRHRRATAVRDAGLRARADYEHRLNMAGDPHGIHGRYPPVRAGWFPDPRDRRWMRYFDGTSWTTHALLR
jgi:uncharacterized protein DUF2510